MPTALEDFRNERYSFVSMQRCCFQWRKPSGYPECWISGFSSEKPRATDRQAWRFSTECKSPLCAMDRDRGEPCGSAPPTPPYVRVRIRRFGQLYSSHSRDALDAQPVPELVGQANA